MIKVINILFHWCQYIPLGRTHCSLNGPGDKRTIVGERRRRIPIMHLASVWESLPIKHLHVQSSFSVMFLCLYSSALDSSSSCGAKHQMANLNDLGQVDGPVWSSSLPMDALCWQEDNLINSVTIHHPVVVRLNRKMLLLLADNSN